MHNIDLRLSTKDLELNSNMLQALFSADLQQLLHVYGQQQHATCKRGLCCHPPTHTKSHKPQQQLCSAQLHNNNALS
jgi:hypothetical protein